MKKIFPALQLMTIALFCGIFVYGGKTPSIPIAMPTGKPVHEIVKANSAKKLTSLSPLFPSILLVDDRL